MMRESFESYADSPGTLRASQAVTTFGPGAIVQMEHDSVLVMGIDSWAKSRKNDVEDYGGHYKKINHPYLEQLLEKDHFRMPRQVERRRVISCRSFPLWGVCPKCSRLQKHDAAPPGGKKSFRCQHCRDSDIYAANFAAVCSNGHLDEFPWEEWAHSRSPEERICRRDPRLRFKQLGQRPGLADYLVRCLDCGASRSGSGATSRDGLGNIVPRCSGSRPWIGDNATEECTDGEGNPIPMRGIQIISASVYYPVTVTALLVPEWLHDIQKCISENKGALLGQLQMNTLHDVAERSPIFEGMREKYGPDEIEQHLKKRFGPRIDPDKNSTEAQIRNKEYDDLMLNEFEGDENLEIAETPVREDLLGHVARLKQVKRLTEVRALWAFTRETPPDPYLSQDRGKGYCRISGKNTNWHPAVESRGEGLLFALDEDRLHGWEKEPAVERRYRSMTRSFESLFSGMGADDPRRLPRYALLHTLAHVMIRRVSAASGYSDASIRERIYSDAHLNGMLLYTATPSSDGSLGGLVRQGKTENFADLITSSVKNSTRCSRDPLCAEDDPAGMKRASIHPLARVNASACYGCVLLPETSCENFNRLLDRRLLFDGDFGYFREWAGLA